jgi:hypothetical protein
MRMAVKREANAASRPAGAGAPALAIIPTASSAPAERLLAQQRTAGNRSVVRQLGRQGVVARKEEKALETKLIGQLSDDERKSLQEVTGIDTITVPDHKDVQNVALKPEFQPGIPASFRAPLTNVLDELTDGWLKKPNTTAAVELDLSGHGGVKTVWRFTHVETKEVTRYLIDLITNQAAATADDTKLNAHKFSIDSSDADFKAVVQQAVDRIPDVMLSQIDGVTFKRGRADATNPTSTAGNYNADKHEVTIFNIGMKQGASRYDENAGYAAPIDDRVRKVIHEIGHAIDEVALRKAFADRRAGAKEFKDKWPANVTVDAEGRATWSATDMPNDELKKLEADGKKFEKIDDAVGKARSETGHGVVGSTPAIATPFKKALDADGSRPLTPYVAEKLAEWKAEKDPTQNLKKQADFLTEAYAEAFSLYISEPETLRALRPKTYAFFKDKQDKMEKDAAKAKKP